MNYNRPGEIKKFLLISFGSIINQEINYFIDIIKIPSVSYGRQLFDVHEDEDGASEIIVTWKIKLNKNCVQERN